jgi:hypothetical protein
MLAPDYPRLTEVLFRFGITPDGLGEVRLSRDEAAAIRACGWTARADHAHPWRCPPLPDQLVYGTCLEHLSGVKRPFLPGGKGAPG